MFVLYAHFLVLHFLLMDQNLSFIILVFPKDRHYSENPFLFIFRLVLVLLPLFCTVWVSSLLVGLLLSWVKICLTVVFGDYIGFKCCLGFILYDWPRHLSTTFRECNYYYGFEVYFLVRPRGVGEISVLGFGYLFNRTYLNLTCLLRLSWVRLIWSILQWWS